MTTPLLFPALQATLPAGGAIVPALLVLLTGGLVGMSIKNMFDSFLGDDQASEAPEDLDDEEMDDSEGLMGEDGGDDEFGDLGGIEDEGDDLGGFGEEGFDDVDDGGGGGGGGGPGTEELEHRLDEIEAEMESVSSTVGTVRTENEQISESVEEVEENVRKLLDIYEMVTRGVNPFADEVDAGMAGGMGGDSAFGLFDDGGGESQQQENIDEGVATADAEGFFDEDISGQEQAPSGGGGGDASVDDVFPDQEEGASGPDMGEEGSFDEELADDEGASEGEGSKSFEDLKDEYEGEDGEEDDFDDLQDDEEDDEPEDAEAAEDDEVDDSEAAEDDEVDDSEAAEDDEVDDPEALLEETEAPTEPEEADVDAEPEPEPEPATEPDPEPATEPAPEPRTSSAPRNRGTEPRDDAVDDDDASDRSHGGHARSGLRSPTTGAGKPYLAELPAGFASDMLVVEWLEYLLNESGFRETARAIDYYESVDWIDQRVADELHTVLRGLDGADGGGGSLTIEHHTRSLRYISQLDGTGGQSVVLSKLLGGGGSDGLQR